MKRSYGYVPISDKRLKLVESSQPNGSMCDGLVSVLLGFVNLRILIRKCTLVCKQWMKNINLSIMRREIIITSSIQAIRLANSMQSAYVTDILIRLKSVMDVDISKVLVSSFPKLKKLSIYGAIKYGAIRDLGAIKSGLISLTLDQSKCDISQVVQNKKKHYFYSKQLIFAYASLSNSSDLSSLESIEISTFEFDEPTRENEHNDLLETILSSDKLINLKRLALKNVSGDTKTLIEFFEGKTLPKLEYLDIFSINGLYHFGTDTQFVLATIQGSQKKRPLLKMTKIAHHELSNDFVK